MIKLKHHEGKEISDDVMLNGPLQRIHSIAYESIDENLVLKAATATKGGSGPSGLDADGWRRSSGGEFLLHPYMVQQQQTYDVQ